MATLGMWFIGVGLRSIMLGGMAIRINDPMIRGLAIERFLGFPWGVWLALACLAVALVIQNHTRLGRYIYALGGGEELAALSGIIRGARAHHGLHARRHLLRYRRHPRGRPARPRQCADRQRPAVHHGDRRRRRRHRAVRRQGSVLQTLVGVLIVACSPTAWC